MRSGRARVRGWVVRYLPLEVLGTLTAVASALVAYDVSGSLAVAAVAGTLGESAGYYSLVAVRASRGHLASRRVRRLTTRRHRVWATSWLSARSMAAEFGPAELVDTLLVRPALFWAAAVLWGPTPLAWLAGKLAADVVFYGIAIVSFEAGRRVILPDGGHVGEPSGAGASDPGPSLSAVEASGHGLASEPHSEGALR